MFIFDVFSAGFLPLLPILSLPLSVFIIIIFLKSNRRRAAIISICSSIDCRLWAVACQIEATLWEEQQEQAQQVEEEEEGVSSSIRSESMRRIESLSMSRSRNWE